MIQTSAMQHNVSRKLQKKIRNVYQIQVSLRLKFLINLDALGKTK